MSLSIQQCPQCQKFIDVDARFCSECGTKLPRLAQTNNPAQQPGSVDRKQFQPTTRKEGEASPSSVAASASASPDDLAWRKHIDLWNGFSLEHPSGWEVCVANDAISICQDREGITKAMINPVQLQQSMSAHELVGELVKKNHAINETFTAWKMNAQDTTYSEMYQGASTDQALLRIRSVAEQVTPIQLANDVYPPNFAQVGQTQTELIGVLSVMVNGTSAIVSGFQAPSYMIEKLKPLFQRILASFQPETRLTRTEYVEPGKRAFTASIPPDWQAVGNLVSTPGGEVIRFRVSDPEGKMSAEAPARTYSFLEETQNEWEMRARAAMQGPPTLSYLPAPAFLERIIVPEMRQFYADFQVENIVNRVDQANAMAAEFIQRGQPLPQKRPTFASLQGTFTQNEIPYRQRIYASVIAPLPSGPAWSAFISSIIRAPLDLFNQHYMILEGIIASVRLGKEWIQEQEMRRQQQQQLFEQLMRQQQMQGQQQMAANQQAFREGQMRRHEMFLNAQQQRFQGQQAAVRNQQDASHRQAQAFIHNVVQGYQYMQNPYSGVRYDVPIGYNNYWANNFGDVVIASNSSYSPGYDFQLLNPLEG